MALPIIGCEAEGNFLN